MKKLLFISAFLASVFAGKAFAQDSADADATVTIQPQSRLHKFKT